MTIFQLNQLPYFGWTDIIINPFSYNEYFILKNVSIMLH